MYLVQNRFLELLAAKSRLEGRKITRETVAKETGISKSSVQSWASNQVTRFDRKQIAVFCKYFNCKPGDLLVLVGEEPDLPEMKTPLFSIA
jgi:DNA-binding Xre family transcriptional regulator